MSDHDRASEKEIARRCRSFPFSFGDKAIGVFQLNRSFSL